MFKLIEEHRDLFTVGEEYHLAHCISGDLALGAGLAKQFRDKMNMKEELRKRYPQGFNGNGCIQVGKVFNLVTKPNFWDKPTYLTLKIALLQMKDMIIVQGIKKLAIPLIGCGLDMLEWSLVKSVLVEVFGDLDIEILVCIK